MRDELDMAYRAESTSASTAHFKLAALHLAQIERASTPSTHAGSYIGDQQLRQWPGRL
jgi:hypothetical protein